MSKKSKNKHANIYKCITFIIVAIILCGSFFYLGYLVKTNSEAGYTNNANTSNDSKIADDNIVNTDTYSGLKLKPGYYKAVNQDNTVSVLIIFKNSGRFKFYPHIADYNEEYLAGEKDNDEGSYWWYGRHWSVDGAGASVENEAKEQINRINAFWHPGNGAFIGQRDSFWFDVQDDGVVIQTSRTTGEVTKYTLMKEF
ncbi:hypothetical protein IKX64_03005 [Candidatus Saccharibacteria bacterium]|nr:hypothetical protein [Candidatus Saccharibacteria bacterium]